MRAAAAKPAPNSPITNFVSPVSVVSGSKMGPASRCQSPRVDDEVIEDTADCGGQQEIKAYSAPRVVIVSRVTHVVLSEEAA